MLLWFLQKTNEIHINLILKTESSLRALVHLILNSLVMYLTFDSVFRRVKDVESEEKFLRGLELDGGFTLIEPDFLVSE